MLKMTLLFHLFSLMKPMVSLSILLSKYMNLFIR